MTLDSTLRDRSEMAKCNGLKLEPQYEQGDHVKRLRKT